MIATYFRDLVDYYNFHFLPVTNPDGWVMCKYLQGEVSGHFFLGPDTSTRTLKTACGGKIVQRLLPFWTSLAAAEASISTGFYQPFFWSVTFDLTWPQHQLYFLRNFGYKWGEGFDLLDPAGFIHQKCVFLKGNISNVSCWKKEKTAEICENMKYAEKGKQLWIVCIFWCWCC